MKYTDIDIWVIPKGYEGKLPPEEDGEAMAADSMNIELDAATMIDTPEGYKKWEQIVIAKEIVQDYGGIKVYKPADSLKAILDHGENRPITDTHPPGKIVTSNTQRCGHIENLTFTDENELKADMIITSAALIDEIVSKKKREVSAGFHAKTIDVKGVFNDVEYSQMQTDILLDHVAMVGKGRCSLSDGCGIKGDAKPHKLVTPVHDGAPTYKVPPEIKQSIDLANKIINGRRIDLIADISAVNDSIDRDTLDAMSIDELERTKTIVAADQKPSFRPQTNSRSEIDAAYAKVGE